VCDGKGGVSGRRHVLAMLAVLPLRQTVDGSKRRGMRGSASTPPSQPRPPVLRGPRACIPPTGTYRQEDVERLRLVDECSHAFPPLGVSPAPYP
jgi:hypothetical protein